MTTAVQVQYRRGTASQVASFTGAQGELIVDSTNNRVTVHDGATAGGFAAAKLSEVVTPPALPGGSLNKFSNSHFDIAQRGTSGSVAAGTTGYTLDRWQITAAGAAAAWAQQYNANVSGNALRINCASGLSVCTLQQRIESYLAARMLTAAKAAQPVTLQFTIYNNTGAAITPQIATGYASSQDSFSTVTADLAATSLQSINNGNIGVVAYTFTPSASLANGYQVQLQFGAALNAASGYVDISLADIRTTPNTSSGLNSSPPPPEVRDPAAEFVLCSRYFTSTYTSAAPGTASAAGVTARPVASNTIANGQYFGSEKFVTRMRASPTVTVYGYGGTSGTVSNSSGTDLAAGTGTVENANSNGFAIANGSGGSVSTSNEYVQYHYAAGAEL